MGTCCCCMSCLDGRGADRCFEELDEGRWLWKSSEFSSWKFFRISGDNVALPIFFQPLLSRFFESSFLFPTKCKKETWIRDWWLTENASFWKINFDFSYVPSVSFLSSESCLAIDFGSLLLAALFEEVLQFFLDPVQGWRDTGFHAALQLPLGTPRLSRQITFRCWTPWPHFALHYNLLKIW